MALAHETDLFRMAASHGRFERRHRGYGAKPRGRCSDAPPAEARCSPWRCASWCSSRSEFMPVSLLTPIASDLRMTEGLAGQAISISGVFAVLTSLVIAGVTARLDRRTVLLSLTASDDRLWNRRRPGPELRDPHGGPGAARCGHRRILVDVDRDRDAPRARGSCSARAGAS